MRIRTLKRFKIIKFKFDYPALFTMKQNVKRRPLPFMVMRVIWKVCGLLITPSRNFMEVRWRSLFRSTSLGKRCASYNAPPTSRKRAADRW